MSSALKIRSHKLDGQILDLKQRGFEASTSTTDADKQNVEKQLATLKAQLAVKSATYSGSHPDIIALKRAIKALEKTSTGPRAAANPSSKTDAAAPDAGSQNTAKTNDQNAMGLDTLLTKKESLKTQLERATQKLAAARLGESLERGRHSERLEVIEQATLPTKPVSPNRLKIFGAAFAIAFMAGGGLVIAREMSDQSIRRSEDIFSIVDSDLIVPIPYISTRREVQQKRKKIILVIAFLVAIIIAAAVAAHYYLPSPDVWYDMVTNKLMKLLLK